MSPNVSPNVSPDIRANMRPKVLRTLIAAIAASSLLLGGCAQLPTGGKVTSQAISVPDPGPVFLTATGPMHNANPQEIVEGFISAQAAGPYDDWKVAREFLTAGAAQKWKPLGQTTVFSAELDLETALPRIGEPTDLGGANGTQPPESPSENGDGNGVGTGGIEPGGAEIDGAEPNGAEPNGAETNGGDPNGTEPTDGQSTPEPTGGDQTAEPTGTKSETDPNRASVTGFISVAATVDESGIYTEAMPDSKGKLNFELLRSATGQWRIATVADGYYISQPNFQSQFRPISLYFLSADQQFLVPEVRWFWRNRIETYAVNALLVGPSVWLQDAVTSAIPSGTRLVYDSVSVDNEGTAHINLSAEVLNASPVDRQNLVSQIHATLLRLPGIRSVDIQVSSVEFVQLPNQDLKRDPILASAPVVLTEDRLQRLNGRNLEMLDPFGSLAGYDVTALSIDAAQTAGVMRLGTSRLARIPGPDGATGAERATPSPEQSDPQESAETSDSAEPSETAGKDPELAILIEGEDLVAPSIDRFGWTWTAEAASPQFRAVQLDATEVTLAATWLAERRIIDVKVSHDGARVAVISTDGAQTQIEVAAVVRDASNAPLSLSTPVTVGSALDDARLMQWLDESNLAVVAHSATSDLDTLFTVTVGGRSDMISNVAGAVSMGAGRGLRSLFIGTDVGEILSRTSTGAAWSIVLEDAAFPTFPG